MQRKMTCLFDYQKEERKYFLAMHECGIKLLLLKLYMDYRIEYQWNYVKGKSMWRWGCIIAKTEINITTQNEFLFTDRYALMSFEEFQAWVIAQIRISQMGAEYGLSFK